MKKHCRETVQRAIGIIDGVAWMTSDENARNALVRVAEKLDGVLTKEERTDDERN